jgi:hypothetical protein
MRALSFKTEGLRVQRDLESSKPPDGKAELNRSHHGTEIFLRLEALDRFLVDHFPEFHLSHIWHQRGQHLHGEGHAPESQGTRLGFLRV